MWDLCLECPSCRGARRRQQSPWGGFLGRLGTETTLKIAVENTGKRHGQLALAGARASAGGPVS